MYRWSNPIRVSRAHPSRNESTKTIEPNTTESENAKECADKTNHKLDILLDRLQTMLSRTPMDRGDYDMLKAHSHRPKAKVEKRISSNPTTVSQLLDCNTPSPQTSNQEVRTLRRATMTESDIPVVSGVTSLPTTNAAEFKQSISQVQHELELLRTDIQTVQSNLRDMMDHYLSSAAVSQTSQSPLAESSETTASVAAHTQAKEIQINKSFDWKSINVLVLLAVVALLIMLLTGIFICCVFMVRQSSRVR